MLPKDTKIVAPKKSVTNVTAKEKSKSPPRVTKRGSSITMMNSRDGSREGNRAGTRGSNRSIDRETIDGETKKPDLSRLYNHETVSSKLKRMERLAFEAKQKAEKPPRKPRKKYVQ